MLYLTCLGAILTFYFVEKINNHPNQSNSYQNIQDACHFVEDYLHLAVPYYLGNFYYYFASFLLRRWAIPRTD